MTSNLCVCFTMDVERIKEQSPPGGPPSWQFAETSVRHYSEVLQENGYPVTFFIVPEAAEEQAELFKGLHREEHECGMHLHPQSWGDNFRHPEDFDYLGGYGPEDQYKMLEQAKEQFAQAIGFPPLCFRSGNFSASDATFSVLESLGFRSGSVSQPNRCAPELRAVWTGADRTVHRAHRASRLIAGDMDFIEVPLTVDVTRSDHWTGVGDTRFEDCDAAGILRAADGEIGWQIDNGALVKHLCLFTHNFVNYSAGDDENETRLPVLKSVLEGLPGIAAKYNLKLKGCTVSGVRQRYLIAEAGTEQEA